MPKGQARENFLQPPALWKLLGRLSSQLTWQLPQQHTDQGKQVAEGRSGQAPGHCRRGLSAARHGKDEL